MRSFKDIIVLTGLNPQGITDQWRTLERGLTTWMNSRHLEKVYLEVWDPSTNRLAIRWDILIGYEPGADGDDTMWEDPDAIRSAIVKGGHVPAKCNYRIVAVVKDGYPDVPGWKSTSTRSTAGLVRQFVGTAVSTPGIRASGGYWRKSS